MEKEDIIWDSCSQVRGDVMRFTVVCPKALRNHVLSLLHTETQGRSFPEILANCSSVLENI